MKGHQYIRMTVWLTKEQKRWLRNIKVKLSKDEKYSESEIIRNLLEESIAESEGKPLSLKIITRLPNQSK